MRKKTIQVLTAVILIGTSVYAGNVWGSHASTGLQSNLPGSVNDPIVTKSYVDELVRTIASGGTPPPAATPAPPAAQTPQLTEAAIKKLIEEEVKKAVSAAPQTPAAPRPVADASLIVVQLKPGQTLMGGVGTEMIVRTGKATAYSNTENGIPDVTDGKDLGNGAEIPLNHLLVFPREGRGIKTDARENRSDIFVMVRGAYLIMNADGTTVSP